MANGSMNTLDKLVAENREKQVATGRMTVDGHKGPDMEIESVYRGVTVGWLAQAFHMDPKTVKAKLKDCPPLHRRQNGFVYELDKAAAYLVKPKFNIEEYLKNMSVTELPTKLQNSYWDAQIKRQKWEETARNLWRTEKVVEVFGNVFQTIKFAMQLWPDDLERTAGLTVEQREKLQGALDGLQNELHGKLVEMAGQKATKSMAAEETDMFVMGDTEGDDDYSHLI